MDNNTAGMSAYRTTAVWLLSTVGTIVAIAVIGALFRMC
jgi:hypothetical protein